MNREERLLTYLKFIAYTVTAILVLTQPSDRADQQVLTGAIAVFLLNGSLRHFWLYPVSCRLNAAKASLLGELLLLILISGFDRAGASILFFLVTVTETVLIFTPALSLTMAAVYLAAKAVVLYRSGSYADPLRLAGQIALGYGISILFTFVMAYLVKQQMVEKEKLRHVNRELEQAYARLLESASKVQALSVEQERTRLAREIHDTLAHTLTVAVVQIEACKKLLPFGREAADAELTKARELVRDGLNDIRRSVRALRPAGLENSSLLDAIANLSDEFSRGTKIRIDFEPDRNVDCKLPPPVEVAVYRIVQESITNSLRHGAADSIAIRLTCSENTLTVTIADNGAGAGSIRKGFGLRGITERAEALRGTVEFTSAPGQGFRTKVCIPLGESKND